MEKCPQCKFKKVKDRTVRDANDRVIEVSSVCGNCGHVKRIKDYTKPRWLRRRG